MCDILKQNKLSVCDSRDALHDGKVCLSASLHSENPPEDQSDIMSSDDTSKSVCAETETKIKQPNEALA